MRKPSPFAVLSSIRKKFTDTFNRENTENDLGLADDGRPWDAVRGIFRVLDLSAFSSDPPSQYPMASVTMPYEDVVISSAPIQNGSGFALWVTDSGNWWGLGLEQEEVDCNCSYATDCNRWNQGGLCQGWNVGNCNRWNARNCRAEACSSWTCSRWNTRNCTGWNVRPCTSWVNIGNVQFPSFRCNSFGNSNCRTFSGGTCASNVCTANTCVRWNSRNCNRWNSRNCNNWTTETCNRWFEFAFDCQKCYPQWIRVIQSTNSTISTVARFVITKTFKTISSPLGTLSGFTQTSFLNKVIVAIKVFVKGKDISVDLFHEANFTDKVDVEEEIVYTATGAKTSPSYGILIIPSSNDQNTFVGPIDIDKN